MALSRLLALKLMCLGIGCLAKFTTGSLFVFSVYQDVVKDTFNYTQQEGKLLLAVVDVRNVNIWLLLHVRQVVSKEGLAQVIKYGGTSIITQPRTGYATLSYFNCTNKRGSNCCLEFDYCNVTAVSISYYSLPVTVGILTSVRCEENISAHRESDVFTWCSLQT